LIIIYRDSGLDETGSRMTPWREVGLGRKVALLAVQNVEDRLREENMPG
jgi:hypothetical protein